MIYVGIDLAWTNKRPSGLCILNDSGQIIFWETALLKDHEIVDIIQKVNDGPLQIAIDAPLIVPNENGSRPCDRLFRKHRVHGHALGIFVSNRAFLNKTYGMIRGELLTQALLDYFPQCSLTANPTNSASWIIETFPTALVYGLFPELTPIEHKIKSKKPYAHYQNDMRRLLSSIESMLKELKNPTTIIEQIEDWRTKINKKNHKYIEDAVDGFLCAYGLYLMDKGGAQVVSFGDEENGFIVHAERR